MPISTLALAKTDESTTANSAWGKNNDVREIGELEGEEERETERISAMTAKQGLAGSVKETITVCSESLFHCVGITFRQKTTTLETTVNTNIF